MIARFLNGPADGDLLQIVKLDSEIRIMGQPPPMSLVAELDDDLPSVKLPIHTYRLQTIGGEPVSDQRGRYLYWHQGGT